MNNVGKYKSIALNYNIGNACNLRCRFCYNDSEREIKQKFLDITQIKDDFINLSKRADRIFLIGGEPLYHPKILEIIDLAHKYFDEVSVVTNGVRFSDKEFTKSILEKGLDILVLSFHAHNDELDEKISQRKGIFKLRIKGLQNLKQFGFDFNKIGFNLVLNSYNIDYLQDIVGFYKSFGIRVFNFYGMLQPTYMSKINYSSIPSYLKIKISLSKLFKDANLIFGVHWIPLCILKGIKGKFFIREMRPEYISNIFDDRKNLLTRQIKHKVKLNICKSCWAYGRFCWGVFKLYVKRYGTEGFKPLYREEVLSLLKDNLLYFKNYYGGNKKI